ncbi:MAG: C10 family peptidase [bacterium]|nr:C10 family peptidase [bacterium]
MRRAISTAIFGALSCFCLFLVLAASREGFGEPVDPSQAAIAARAWYKLRFQDNAQEQPLAAGPESFITGQNARPIVAKETTIGFAFDVPEGGCIAIVADDELTPVLYYSRDNTLHVPEVPPAQVIMDAFADRISELRHSRYPRTRPPDALWALLVERTDSPDGIRPSTPTSSGPVGPLLTTSWLQATPYEDKCPQYQGERCTVGCTAIAMAQIMRYWRHPEKGTGSHCYRWSLGEETLCADFGSTTYDWDNMTDQPNPSSPQVVKDAVSTLCYHCAVAANTEFSPDESPGYMHSGAMTRYFRYKHTRYVEKSGYTDADWYDVMREQVSKGQPVLYGMVNHALVLDGYDIPNLVHLNMGWGGGGDGWYPVGNFPYGWESCNAVLDIAPHRETSPKTYYVNGGIGRDDWDGTEPLWRGGTSGPKKSIQAGICAAGAGDTVIVADGTYTGAANRTLDLGGCSITLRSANGPAGCVIDCERGGRGFLFKRGETEDVWLSGLTIRGGRADDWGGGIACLWGSSPTIATCVITQNSAQWGGGIYSVESHPTITGCVISENSAVVGGGVFCKSGDATLAKSVIRGNSAQWGGGLGRWDGTVRNCVISGNTAEQVGGGAYECNGAIQNTTISKNSAQWGGGLGGCTANLQNCIVHANTSTYYGALYDCAVPIFSCIQDWAAGGEGNTARDPGFADIGGGDWRLRADSPCIDAGKNEDWMWRATDMDGNLRVFYGGSSLTVDMGAYEFGSLPFRVLSVVSATGGGTKLTWYSRPGDTYVIWSSGSLLGDQWTSVATIPSQGTTTSWTHSAPSGRMKLYRVEMR